MRRDSERLERLPRFAWLVIAVLALTVAYTSIQVTMVRPYLWPAGTGARLAEDPAGPLPLLARAPDISKDIRAPYSIAALAAGTPADSAGLRSGDLVVAITSEAGARITLEEQPDRAARLRTWRELYWLGVDDPVRWTVRRAGETREVALDRPAVWRSPAPGWSRRHLGTIVQTIVFAGGALVLFLIRSHDRTAGLAVLALALSAVGNGGPLLGVEASIPAAGRLLTIFSWIASPFAFPVIALAILYFPSRSPLLARYPGLHAVPFLAAAPMILPSVLTALYLTGAEAAAGAALWDASHPGVYYASFAVALGINLVAVLEGLYRYRFNHDANERRRIRMAVYTVVPGVIAYALRDGVQIVAMLGGAEAPQYPTLLFVLLQALVLLPAFGLVYAVGVARVLGPRVVLRRSLQYALASRTLSVLAVLPAVALAVSLVRHRDRTLAEIVASGSGFYLALLAATIAAFRYRDRARTWLDQRFFREEYDARKILLSLASRVRFETDPSDLANLVVGQIDEALHPEMVAILVSGVEEGRLTPVAVLHGSAEALPLEGGLVSMLRWSDEPLEIFLQDPRSPARRLPADEQEWLECTGAVLLVPVVAEDRSLIGVIVLGERRSEEAYTAEDRQLLASIAAQMGLGFDVARLRRRIGSAAGGETETTHMLTPALRPMMECPRCGRCEEADVAFCPADGVAMRPVPSVPKVVDRKYRLEQLLGRGGMGAVYRARDVRLDRLVALKVVRAELLGDQEMRRRFRREAQLIARLQHPSIVAVFDYGTFADGGAYLVMELVKGEDLRRVLQREGRLELQRTLGILESVCGAIETAHREGVLHRDLKPENILLPGGGTVAKVLDFGVAKLMIGDDDALASTAESATALTAAGALVGTPAYMAPEQFHGMRADARTDVFALGVVTYEMLTGELPFGRGSLAEVVLSQARGVPPMPAGLVPPAVERAVRTALEMDPDRRPASPQAFAHLVASAARL